MNPNELLKKHFTKKVKRWLLVWGTITITCLSVATVLVIVIISVVGGGGGNESSSNLPDGSVYDPSMIKAVAKAMDADPSDEFIKNLEAVIMNESGGVADAEQGITDMNSGGNEAVGILQYTPGTMAAYAIKGYEDRTSAVDELIAFFNNSDWKNSIGWTTIWGHRKMEWLHSGPQGSRRFDALPGKLDKDALEAGDIKVTGEKMSFFDKAFKIAKTQLGKPYVFGASLGDTSGFDCSSYTWYIMKNAGVTSLPRTAQAQYDATKRVSAGSAKAGDLIFFHGTYDAGVYVTHVGMVVSKTQMINASGSEVKITDFTSSYWKQHVAGFGRIK